MFRNFSVFVPLAVLAAVVFVFALSLLNGKDPSVISSALIGKPVPVFSLPAAIKGGRGLSSEDFGGRVAVVNFFSSWCVSCRAEQGLLGRIARNRGTVLYGIDYKDKPHILKKWLAENGNPFAAIGDDRDGRAAIEWGVYGVPETHIVDSSGIVRYRHAGPVTEDVYEKEIVPLLESMAK